MSLPTSFDTAQVHWARGPPRAVLMFSSTAPCPISGAVGTCCLQRSPGGRCGPGSGTESPTLTPGL